MSVPVPLEHPGVQAGRRSIVMIENVLNFAQGHTQLVEGMGCRVPGDVRFPAL
jgi:hypothetical protein